jgi:glycosyltransferase involved in cell wall biosynthesis
MEVALPDMRVFYFAYLSDTGEGPKNHVEDFLMHFSQNQKISNLDLFTNLGCHEFPKLREPKFKIHTIFCGKSSMSVFRFQLRAARELYTKWRETPQFVVYIRHCSFLFLVLLFRLQKMKKAIIIEVNTIPNKWLLENKKKFNLRKQFLFCFDRFVFKMASHITVVCPNFAANLHANFQIHPSKTTVIPNGYHQSQIPDLTKLQARERLGFRPHGRYCIYVGSLTEYEGVIFLSRAIRKFLNSSENLDVVFAIVGEGELRSPMQEILGRNIEKRQVVFTGNLKRQEMYQHILASDVCLYTPPQVEYGFCSQRGGSALKVVDYLACGRAVLFPDDDYYRYVEENRLGRLYKSGDIPSFTQLLEKMLSEDDLLEEFSQNCLKYAQGNLLWEKTLAPLKRFFVPYQ